MKSLSAAVALAVCGLLSATASAAVPIHFSPTLNLPTGFSETTTVAPVLIGDIDGDGFNDIVASVASPPASTAVMRGDGAGNFTAPKTLSLGSPVDKHAIGDVNGDGRADVLVRTDVQHVAVLFGQADAGLLGGPSFAVPASSVAEVADVNGDHTLDVVVLAGNTIKSYLGDGHGAFAPPVTQVVSSAVSPATTGVQYNHRAAIADLDGDGHPDIVIGTWAKTHHRRTKATIDPILVVLPGLGDGRFKRPVASRVGVSYATIFQPEIADFNHDGRPDLAGAAVTRHNPMMSVFVSENLGHGRFANVDCYGPFRCKPFGVDHPHAEHADVAAGDFNADGNPDVVLTTWDDGYPRVLSGDGHGGFREQLKQGVVRGDYVVVTTANLNHDATTDIAFSTTTTVSVITGQAG